MTSSDTSHFIILVSQYRTLSRFSGVRKINYVCFFGDILASALHFSPFLSVATGTVALSRLHHSWPYTSCSYRLTSLTIIMNETHNTSTLPCGAFQVIPCKVFVYHFCKLTFRARQLPSTFLMSSYCQSILAQYTTSRDSIRRTATSLNLFVNTAFHHTSIPFKLTVLI